MACLFETQVQPPYCEVSRVWKQHGYDVEGGILGKLLELDKVIQLEPHDQIPVASKEHERAYMHVVCLSPWDALCHLGMVPTIRLSPNITQLVLVLDHNSESTEPPHKLPVV